MEMFAPRWESWERKKGATRRHDIHSSFTITYKPQMRNIMKWKEIEEARWERDKHRLMSNKNLAFMERWCRESREVED